MLWRRRFQDAVPEVEDERPLACCVQDAFDLSRHPSTPGNKYQRIEVALDAAPQGALDCVRGPT